MPGYFLLTSPSGDGKYCQAISCAPYYLVFSLEGPAETVNLKFGHDLIAQIQNILSTAPPQTPTDLISLLKKYLPAETRAHLLAAKLEGAHLTIALEGEMKAKLLRDGKIVSLLSQSGTVSGPVKPNDYLFLGTYSFFEEIFDPKTAANQEVLLLKMEERTDKTRPLACLVLCLDSLEVAESSPSPTSPPSSATAPLPAFNSTPRRFLALRHSFRLPANFSRKTLYAAALALIFLICLIAFQLRSRHLEIQTQSALALETQTREQMESAKKFIGINDNLARDILSQAKNYFLSQAEQVFGHNWQDQKTPEAQKLKSVLLELDNQLALASRIYSLSALESFSDFSLLRPDATIADAALRSNQIVVVDSRNAAVYSLATKTKTVNIIGGAEDFKLNPLIDFSGTRYFVFTPNGIYSEKKLIIKPSEKWGQIKGLQTFAGNLYLLDTANSQIWKYQGTDFGFEDASAYLRLGGADFSKVTSFAIDGAIYVLSSSGHIVKFSGGYAEDFSISGLETPLSNPTSIFTSDETQNIYILDSGNNRVVVLDKKGVYQAQYLLPSLNQPIVKVLADESINKVFLLSGSKAYFFDLR